MPKISIILADAQYLIRLGLRHIFSNNPQIDVIGEAENERELLHLLSIDKPDILILDYQPAVAFTKTIIQHTKEICPSTKILIISTDNDKNSIYEALELGADGFLTKACEEEEILDAIFATAKGERFFCNKVINYIMERSFPKTNTCAQTPLSKREIEIVTYISKGLIAKEIADILHLSIHTIYTHRKNIMKKLGITSTSELILYALDSGIIVR